MLSERDLVERYFKFSKLPADVVVGIGDDAAVLTLPGQTALTVDTLLAGTHFHPDTDPYFLGRKALAVNLSDLAAMGANPRYAVLSLTLPKPEANWLRSFAAGMAAVSHEYGVTLVGGDLSRGKTVSITITVLGDSTAGIMTQNGAQIGDDLWVSGTIGVAGEQLRKGTSAYAGSALHDPTPRIALGQVLVGIATAAIDLSDGLCAGVVTLARASNLRIEVDASSIPIADLKSTAGHWDKILTAICSGEDYELLFTAPKTQQEAIAACGVQLNLPLARIGSVVAGQGSLLQNGNKTSDLEELIKNTYQHFSSDESYIEASAQGNRWLAQAVGAAIKNQQGKLFTAESCTGGMLAGTITALAGSSDWFTGGAVTYAAAAKQAMLGVSELTIAEYGVVSIPVAKEMCVGALATGLASHAISITGWAGPTSNESQSVGTVCIGWASPQCQMAREFVFPGGRNTVQIAAVRAALAGMCALISSST